MPFRRTLLGLAVAVATLGVASAAQAAPAFASSTVNVRSGAGTGYAVVDVLRRGEAVDVDYCRGSWCYVNKSGPDGWVSANYLVSDRYDDEDRYDDDRYDDGYDDDFYIVDRPHFRPRYRPYYPGFGSQFCWGGYSASVCIQD